MWVQEYMNSDMDSKDLPSHILAALDALNPPQDDLYWSRLRHETAAKICAAIWSNNDELLAIHNKYNGNEGFSVVATQACKQADALIEELRK